MTWLCWTPLAVGLLVLSRGDDIPDCSLGEVQGACCADCDSLLQVSQSVGPAEEPERLRWDAGRGNLCALAASGRLVKEVVLFLEGVSENKALAKELISKWVAVCTGTGASDAGLVNALRAVVRSFAAAGSGSRDDASSENQSNQTVEISEAEERKMWQDYCEGLAKELESVGQTTSTRILDYGCGGGDTLGSFGRCGYGKDNVGVDVQDARGDLNKEFFKFIQLSPPYTTDFGQKIASENLAGQFGFVTSDRVFHHVGSEADIRATARQLAKVIAPCGVFVLQDWDNPGDPDLTPFYDLTHTFWSTLCLPYTKEKAEQCTGDISDDELHKMWEGERTVYLSQGKYRQIMESEAGLTLMQGRSAADPDGRKDPQLLQMGVKLLRRRSNFSFTVRGVDDTDWGDILHPFTHVYKRSC